MIDCIAYFTFTTGSVPSALCELENLNSLELNGNAVVCFPRCLTVYDFAHPACDKTHTEQALCDLITYTTISTVFSNWSCSALGVPNSDYCSWVGVTCVGKNITELNLGNYDLSGKNCFLYSMQCIVYIALLRILANLHWFN